MTNALPPGWYPDQRRADVLRFWDGEKWSDQTAQLADSDLSSVEPVTQRPQRTRRLWRTLVVLAVSLVGIAAVALGAISLWSAQGEFRRMTNRPPIVTKSVAPLPQPSEVPRSLGPGDSFYKSLGYEVIESGRIYALAADASTFTCGSDGCLYYTVVVLGGCPSNLYAEASILSNGVVVGYANDLVGAVASGEDAVVLFEDFSGQGDSFRISKVNCY